jgi:hypothetical protein
MGGLKTQISGWGRENRQDGDNELKIKDSVVILEDFSNIRTLPGAFWKFWAGGRRLRA